MSTFLKHLEKQYALDRLTEKCPYLGDRRSSLLFLNGFPIADQYRTLLDEGYRRSGALIYRPDCGACKECKVLRVPVADFTPSKSQRRVWNRCHGQFRVEITKPEATREKVALYERYLHHKHGGINRKVTLDDYHFFFVLTTVRGLTRELQLWDGDRLAGVGVADCFSDALSSVYFYYDPDYSAWSLGVYSILLEIDLARQWGLDYYYLGYYIAGCPSMSYKERYRPCEIRTPGESVWERRARRVRSSDGNPAE